MVHNKCLFLEDEDDTATINVGPIYCVPFHVFWITSSFGKFCLQVKVCLWLHTNNFLSSIPGGRPVIDCTADESMSKYVPTKRFNSNDRI